MTTELCLDGKCIGDDKLRFIIEALQDNKVFPILHLFFNQQSVVRYDIDDH